MTAISQIYMGNHKLGFQIFFFVIPDSAVHFNVGTNTITMKLTDLSGRRVSYMYTMEFVSPATAGPFTQITLYFVFTLSTCRVRMDREREKTVIFSKKLQQQ
jgi:hypothetical protein